MDTKYENECDEEIPSHIVSKAKEKGCINHLYIYKDSEYCRKLPAASIGCIRAKRFESPESAELMKIHLGDGWVVFKSPTKTGSNRSEGKGICIPCIICGEDRFTDGAHFPKPKRDGGAEMIPLCPTHHKLLDNGRLSLSELKVIWQNKYSNFNSFIDFMKWANKEQYRYSINDLQKKKLWRDYEEKEVRYKVSNLHE